MGTIHHDDEDGCFFCGVLGGGHDCDCRLSSYPKCSECGTAYRPTTELEAGLACYCGNEQGEARQ